VEILARSETGSRRQVREYTGSPSSLAKPLDNRKNVKTLRRACGVENHRAIFQPAFPPGRATGPRLRYRRTPPLGFPPLWKGPVE